MISYAMVKVVPIKVIMKSRKSWFKTTKSGDLQADTSALEGEIDQLVAPRQLYGLTEDEVKIVEGKE